MSLGAPWMLLLLPIVGVTGRLQGRARRLQHEAACQLKGIEAESLPSRLTRSDYLKLAALVCIVLALSRPRWNPRPYDVHSRGRDLVFVVDVSRSMLAADVFPNRLEMARIAIQETLPTLVGRRVGLVTFAGSASIRVPLTLDHEFVRYMLERMSSENVDMGSTSLQAAIEKIANSVLSDAAGSGRDVIIFTDGEDHLGNPARTADRLAECGARVLMVGLGDPVNGARVPDVFDEQQWMTYDGVEVISRLQEDTLAKLARQATNVTYFSARTRPFDLVTLYQQWVSGTNDKFVVKGVQHVRYTEGYSYLLMFAVALWLASMPICLAGRFPLLLLAVLLPACSRTVEDGGDAAFRARFKQGSELTSYAQELSETDPFAGRSLFKDAREQFLLAALLKEGDVTTARQITAITRRLGELDVVIERKRDEQERQAEKLEDMIERLEALTSGQEDLAQRSQSIMRSRPILSEADYNNPESTLEQLPSQDELEELAPAFASDQKTLHEGTNDLLAGLVRQQQSLREILTRAYGNVGQLPPTEIDPIVQLLTHAGSEQEQALTHLEPNSVQWPQVNTAFHAAAGRMAQAAEALRKLQPPSTDENDDNAASRPVANLNEEMEQQDSGSQDGGQQPAASGDLQQALSLQSLPIPNYTAEEILAEEAANQKKRTRRKAARAGARVEKNW
jgi:Ca-activated chloride channel family protein